MNDDLISRQAAIEAVEPYTDDIYNSTAREIKEVLQTLPSVQLKTGRWKVVDDSMFAYCSECKDSYYQIPIDPTWEYCPNCGAKMEER